MGNETRRILDLLANGKITADEAEQLIAALGQPQESAANATPPPAEGTSAPPTGKKPPKWLRVVVYRMRPDRDNVAAVAGCANDVNVHLGSAGHFTVGRARKNEVNVRIPLAFVRAGMKLGAMMPGIAGEEVTRKLRERGIDLSKIDPADLEDAMKELGEMTVDVDDGKSQVRIFCE
jgi:hypothetical protein